MARNNGAQEPWEKSIYDTDYEPTLSRAEQRKQQKGNALFLKVLVVLLIIICGVPISAWVYMHQHAKNNTATVATSSSVVSTSTTTATSTAKSSSTKETKSTSSSEEANTEETSSTQTSSSKKTSESEEYVQVLAGEGLSSIADRTGVSVEKIAELNGITLNADGSFTPAIQPGQQLRVK